VRGVVLQWREDSRGMSDANPPLLRGISKELPTHQHAANF
jgi:hypothetical protein